ncbi:uncharacterized protein At4g08330, chloroplastic-like [Mangifera indica]|uniref:uncharacterized protein At4g08330, chloroplastic-like n=1 Tax=Mangifera indica TaxID=29780 RepID=UPI001CF9A05D|nr:uncharacterized protein At4g08330, chloroplastic-like [Mangifera indica]
MTKKGTERTTRYITWSPLSFSFFLLFEVLSPSTESSNCYSLVHLSLELARRLSDPIQAGQVRRQTLKISLYVLSVPLLFKVTVSIRAVDFCEVMDKSSPIVNENHHHSFSSSASQRHVSYSCGSCGYELNLSSSNRNISTIGSKYGKSMKRGIISFVSIDESRFTQVDELQCIPYLSKNTWGFFRHRTKLLCRKCGNHIGNAYDDKTLVYPPVPDESNSSSGNYGSGQRKYNVRIRALQPSSADGSGTSLFS